MGCVTSTTATGYESPCRHIEAVTVGVTNDEKPRTLPPQKPHKDITKDKLGEGTFATARGLTDGKKPQRKQFHQQYILKEKIGQGSHGQVHSATAVAEGNEVAVKVVDRFQGKSSVVNEVAALKRLSSQPYVVGLYESYREDTLIYVVMERCEMTLLQALESAPELTERTLAPMITETLRALDGIHKLRVAHLDIKPDNFLCSGESRTVKLCDFSLAKVLLDHDTMLRGVVGTPPFMSPEMLRLENYDTKTDVWSLGVTAYVLLCGQFPYQPEQRTSQGMKHAILAGTPEPTFQPAAGLDLGGAGLSRASADLLRALLDRDYAARPGAADALQLPWLAAPPADLQEGGQSLWPVLHAAKRAGAFEVRAMDFQRSMMDITLASLQAGHHGRICPDSAMDGSFGNGKWLE